VPATVDKTNKDLSPVVVAGRSQTFDCVVRGVPTPKLAWFRDGSRLALDQHTNIRVTLDGRHLQVTMATLNDTGVYRCRAANKAGRDDVAYNLTVHGEHRQRRAVVAASVPCPVLSVMSLSVWLVCHASLFTHAGG